MEDQIAKLENHWKQTISRHIQSYVPYRASEQLNQMAALFTPGLYYYYILNFHNLHMDFVSEGTREVLGVEPGDFTVKAILGMLPEEEQIAMQNKEALLTDFLFNFLNPEEIRDYKVVYFMKIRDTHGKLRTILHQVVTLTVSDTGKVEHALGIHTDVSHLGVQPNHKVSLISLSGERPSYFNLDPEFGKFDPDQSEKRITDMTNCLSDREKDIIALFSKGFSAKEIAKELYLAFNTVRTHRNNILTKTGCANTTELVARCLMEGVI